MKLFTGDISVIKDEIENLREHVCRCKNVNEARSVLFTIYALIDVYFSLDGKEVKSWKNISKNRYYSIKAEEQSLKLYKKYINNFIENKDIHKDLMNQVMLRYEDEYENIKDFYYDDKMLSDDQMIKIMCDFLDTMGKNDKEKFFKLIDDKKIFLLHEKLPSYDGMCTYNCINGESIIVLSDNYENSVMLMTTLMHEFGHVIDYDDLYMNHSFKEKGNFFATSSYQEVISEFYEKEFLRYLISNNIEVDAAKRELESHYTALFNNVEDLLLLTNLPNRYLKNNMYYDLDNEEINMILMDNNDEYYSFYENIDNDNYPLENIEIHDADVYAYGGLLSNYLSYVKHHDKEKFNRIYNNFNTYKAKKFSPSILTILETTKEKIVDVLFDELKVIQEDGKVYKKSNN